MPIKSAAELKRLQTRLAEQESSVKAAKDRMIEAQRVYADESKKLVDVQDSLRKLRDSMAEPIVTEHALLRYCQRVLGINMEEIKNKIVSSSVRELIDTLGSGQFPADGFKVIVKQRQVVSIETNDKPV